MFDLFAFIFLGEVTDSLVSNQDDVYMIDDLLKVRIPDLSFCIFRRALSIILAFSRLYQRPMFIINFNRI